MQTEYQTVSDSKPLDTGHAIGGPLPAKTLSPGPRPLVRANEVLIFPKSPSDMKVSAERVSQMQERMEAKDELLFAPAIDARLKIRAPFRVRIISTGEGVSAYAADIDEFGHGANRGEALDDLGRTIAELYFSLSLERERLSPDLSAVLNSLEGHITRVRG